MKEFSEKELEDKYKDWKMMDVPPMWDVIEKNLAPKKIEGSVSIVKKRRFSVRRMAAAAAAVCLLLLWPVLHLAQQGEHTKSDSGAGENSSPEYAWEGETAGGAPEESMDMAENADAEGSIEEDEGMLWSEAAADKADGYEETVREAFQVEIQVKEVQVLKQGVQVTAWITEQGDGPYQNQEEVTILYEGDEYGEADFSGILRVRLQKVETILKLLEILP